MKSRIPWTLAIGAALTAIAIVKMYEKRGSFEIGGEWLIIPLLLILGGAFEAIIHRR